MSFFAHLKGKTHMLEDITQNTNVKTEHKTQKSKHGSHKLQSQKSKHPYTKTYMCYFVSGDRKPLRVNFNKKKTLNCNGYITYEYCGIHLHIGKALAQTEMVCTLTCAFLVYICYNDPSFLMLRLKY